MAAKARRKLKAAIESMRGIGLFAAILLAAPRLSAQGISPEQTRQMIIVSEMGHSLPKAPAPPPMTFEQGDDPTVDAHPVAAHRPSRAALKSAERADRLAKNGRLKEAIAKYRDAVARDPLYFEAWNNLALELSAAGQKGEAEQLMRRLEQSNPEHVVAFTNLAELLSGEGRYTEAEEVARAAMNLHSHSYSANYVLGTVLINQGKWSGEARAKLEYAQAKYPLAKSLVERWPPAR